LETTKACCCREGKTAYRWRVEVLGGEDVNEARMREEKDQKGIVFSGRR
jgi:hypothetical protein